jgi:hypothetical protein
MVLPLKFSENKQENSIKNKRYLRFFVTFHFALRIIEQNK